MPTLGPSTTDAAVVTEIGRRLARHRIARDLTQAEFAERAGVGRSTVQRLEGGESIQLTSLVRILRALDLLEGLELLVPEGVASPLAELERAQRRPRMRVRHRDGDPGVHGEGGPWRWGDEPDGDETTDTDSSPGSR